jgi:hypothetical protein
LVDQAPVLVVLGDVVGVVSLWLATLLLDDCFRIGSRVSSGDK